MKRPWLIALLAVGIAILIFVFSRYPVEKSRIYLVQDAFDPLSEVIAPFAGDALVYMNPYHLGYQLSGIDGMAFVFGPQARPYLGENSSARYVPLYSATIVIAVNKNGNSSGAIDGWKTLMNSNAVLLVPDNGIESARLTAIAFARALGAQEGDLSPALKAFAFLRTQDRLNPRSEYFHSGYKNMYAPDRLSEYDAVILWDYQAKTLSRFSEGWDIIFPVDGSLTVDCGYVHGGTADSHDDLLRVQEYLLSEEGEKAMFHAGFSPLAEIVDLQDWDRARLTYNPKFRREVWQAKLYAPASVRERLLVQCVIILLFSIAAQRILRRIPPGPYRTISLTALLFVLFWMLTGVLRAQSLSIDLSRLFWFASYIPRQGLPVLWFCMCYAHVHNRLPSPKKIILMGLVAFFLSVFVLTNDCHQLVFLYQFEEPASWDSQYSYVWGYFLSLIWSFSVSILGLLTLFRMRITRQQGRQLIEAGLFFLALVVYQFSYMIGIEHVIDLDIPTTVAIFILVFLLAAQQERFLGASLLALPIFQNSTYALSVCDVSGEAIYKNNVMESIEQNNPNASDVSHVLRDNSPFVSAGRTYSPLVYKMDKGQVLVYEDITALKQLEDSMEKVHMKLEAIKKLLLHQVNESRGKAGSMEQERYADYLNRLLHKRLEEIRTTLQAFQGKDSLQHGNGRLGYVRYLIYICHRRLHLIIRSLESHPWFPVQLVSQYAQGVIRDGRQLGLDGVLSNNTHGNCPAILVEILLEVIDSICLSAFDCKGSSLICRTEANAISFTLHALLSVEEDQPLLPDAMLPKNLAQAIERLGGKIYQQAVEDGLVVRLHFLYAEVVE